MTVHCSKYFGLNARRMKGSDDHWYLTFIAWFPKGKRLLGYRYFSCRWF